MSNVQTHTTGKYPYDFTTGTLVLILKRDKFAREDITRIIKDDKLDDKKRKDKISRRIRILLNDTRDGANFDDIIKAVLEIENEVVSASKAQPNT